MTATGAGRGTHIPIRPSANCTNVGRAPGIRLLKTRLRLLLIRHASAAPTPAPRTEPEIIRPYAVAAADLKVSFWAGVSSSFARLQAVVTFPETSVDVGGDIAEREGVNGEGK
jgi:hypothetical protein